MYDYDIVIVGAGIAGASLAYELARYYKILIIEQEYAPGYHATGRSAAFWSQTYGGPFIEPLTSASGAFLSAPPSIFHDKSFLYNRGAINIAKANQLALVDDMVTQFSSNAISLETVDADFLQKHIPKLRTDWAYGIWESGCSDIDVASLHGAYLRNAKRLGVDIICKVEFEKAQPKGDGWLVKTNIGDYRTKILINAAGAWADKQALASNIRPVGITPLRRTMIELEVKEDIPENLPLIVALDGSFYFKAMAKNHIWLSPHDETISPARDVAPEEIDIAIAIDRLQKIVDWEILEIKHKWAGLRSFSPDRLPVIGFDNANKNYFWFVGQGGFGIQTAPAAAKLAACILTDKIMPSHLSHIDYGQYSPDRFRKI